MIVRGFGLVGALVALALVGALWALQAGHSGSSSKLARAEESRGEDASATSNFAQARMQLQGYYAENGTYVGATLPTAFGVAVVRADAASYCLQSGAGATVRHLLGPGGNPAAGPC